MANSEHVALAREGREAIAKWRQAHPGEILIFDLEGADLRKARLRRVSFELGNVRGANLGGADLHGANFYGADMSHANLHGANLSGAMLAAADVSGADLSRASLIGTSFAHIVFSDPTLEAIAFGSGDLRRPFSFTTNLAGTDFSDAILVGADLSRAHLNGTVFSRALMGLTSFGQVDLSRAEGLATVAHLAASTVGVDTVMASFRGAGNCLTTELRAFFQDAGVPRELLDAFPGIMSVIRYFSCFISYGQPDVEFAKQLYGDLRDRGVTCWLYQMDRTVGRRTKGEISEARRSADKFIVLCSAAALVREGVLEEIEDQVNEDAERIVPISLDNLWKDPGFKIMRNVRSTDLKPFLLDRNYADFANYAYPEALEELLRGLERPRVEPVVAQGEAST